MAEEVKAGEAKEDKGDRKKRLLQKKFEKAVKALGLLGKVKGLNENQVGFIVGKVQTAFDEMKKKLSAKTEEAVKETVAAIPG